MLMLARYSMFFFFNDTATTEIYTLSLHDALPILDPVPETVEQRICPGIGKIDRTCREERIEIISDHDVLAGRDQPEHRGDRKSTRLNSSHQIISYAVFCLKKKNYYDVLTASRCQF